MTPRPPSHTTTADGDAPFPGSEFLLPADERSSLQDASRIIAIRDELRAFLDDLDWPHEDTRRLRLALATLDDAVRSFCPHTSEAYIETDTTVMCPYCRFTMPNMNVPVH